VTGGIGNQKRHAPLGTNRWSSTDKPKKPWGVHRAKSRNLGKDRGDFIGSSDQHRISKDGGSFYKEPSAREFGKKTKGEGGNVP